MLVPEVHCIDHPSFLLTIMLTTEPNISHPTLITITLTIFQCASKIWGEFKRTHFACSLNTSVSALIDTRG